MNTCSVHCTCLISSVCVNKGNLAYRIFAFCISKDTETAKRVFFKHNVFEA